MIRCSCPRCLRNLAFPDDRGGPGLTKTCPFCGHQFTDSPLITGQAPEGGPSLGPSGGAGFSGSPLVGAQAPGIQVPAARPLGGLVATGIARPPRDSWLRDYGGYLLIAGVIVFGLGTALLIYLIKKDVCIYVDNGGSQPLEVSLDGSHAATVAPGQVEPIKCRTGRTRIQVKRGGEVVFDEVKDLQKPDKQDLRRYVLNPEETRRYWIYQVEYGNPFSAFNLSQFDPLMLGMDHDQWVKAKYQELARKPNLMEPRPWVDAEIEACDFVLEKAPASLKGEMFAKRRVLAHIDRRDYDLIVQARKKTNPTFDDLQALTELIDRITNEAQ
jgi:hypothetical protein